MRTTGNIVRVALTGGGTGGHVYPLVSVMQAMQGSQSNVEFHYFGKQDQFSSEVLKRGAMLHSVPVGKWRRYFSLLNITDIPKVGWSFIVALWKMFWLMPDVLFSKGGPGALPVVFACWFYRIPIVVHESDVIPGLTNLLSAYLATRIAVGFESAGKYFNPNKMVLVGNPVRDSLIGARMEQAAAKERLGFDPARPLLAVIGGSQGAQQLNEFVVLNLATLLPVTQIYHQTGMNNFAAVDQLAKTALMSIPIETEAKSRYKYVPYVGETDGVDMLALVLSAADVVVGRAGAGSIFEFAAFGRPSILVPLDGHQRENAYAYSSAGAASVIEQENLTASIFFSELNRVLGNPGKAAEMSANALKFYKPDSAKMLAAEILQLAG
jgi:UDP-N-acetylglucosamine--N-acetylmuramyl-(pentapeptide) pyrophosphoryl-undecaprenol N-acetylglucosamine transferase